MIGKILLLTLKKIYIFINIKYILNFFDNNILKYFCMIEKIGVECARNYEKYEEISTHKSDGDAMVTVLDGVGKITIDDTVYTLKEGETIIMPAGHPHAVEGLERFKMLLVVTF